MQTILHKAETRGYANHGWLEARHTFSFANYYNAQRMNFGALRVLNDDIIQANTGFGMHPHDNMEIVTIPISGELQHTDNMGYTEIIKSGDIQRMSAGTGILHSEFNKHESLNVNLLQIWVFPEKKNITPSYEQKTFNKNLRINNFQTVVAPISGGDNLFINQNSWFSLANFEKDFKKEYIINSSKNGVYAFVINGNIQINGIELLSRDGLGVWNTSNIDIYANEKSEFLIIEVPVW